MRKEDLKYMNSKRLVAINKDYKGFIERNYGKRGLAMEQYKPLTTKEKTWIREELKRRNVSPNRASKPARRQNSLLEDIFS
jgi:hypothetical protein